MRSKVMLVMAIFALAISTFAQGVPNSRADAKTLPPQKKMVDELIYNTLCAPSTPALLMKGELKDGWLVVMEPVGRTGVWDVTAQMGDSAFCYRATVVDPILWEDGKYHRYLGLTGPKSCKPSSKAGDASWRVSKDHEAGPGTVACWSPDKDHRLKTNPRAKRDITSAEQDLSKAQKALAKRTQIPKGPPKSAILAYIMREPGLEHHVLTRGKIGDWKIDLDPVIAPPKDAERMWFVKLRQDKKCISYQADIVLTEPRQVKLTGGPWSCGPADWRSFVNLLGLPRTPASALRPSNPAYVSNASSNASSSSSSSASAPAGNSPGGSQNSPEMARPKPPQP